ncbi:beta-glucosidase [Sarracenia purpurea var. burkii]
MSKMEHTSFAFKNPSEPIESRVKDLLSRMTLKEKIGQMTQIDRRIATPSAIRDLSIGSVLSAGGGGPFEKATSSDWADMVDGFQKAALQSRLGIPLLYGTDAVHGNNNVYGATVFPHNVGLGATRDAELVRRIGVATALEVRACGAQFTFAPCVAVCRDPRWGRCYESYGEDTELVRKMTSIVTGLQGEPPQQHPKDYPFVAGRKNVVACAKHFIGDGGTDKGINEGNTIASYGELERIHMAPFLDCISQGVCTIMASYSSWNGRKLHSHHFLLTQVLKEKLGFKGFVISDSEALDRLSDPYGSNYQSCVLSSINAGIDMVMVPFRYELFIEDLTYLVESGEIPISRIDDAVERILRVKFVAGIFEYPMADRSLLDTVGCKLHRELARDGVRKSLVLLKNGKDPKKPFLPLDRNAGRILVAGTHADNLGYQCGGWTATWMGASGRITIGTTILEAIKEAIGKNTDLVYDQRPSADTFASQDFSFAIVAVGEGPYAETLGDDSELKIPFNGTELISSVAERVPTLVILISGRPLVLEPWLLEKIDALVAAWLPGSEGEGIADVIFGDYEFQGRLPVTWFKRTEHLPMHTGENSYDPLFPFGFGLKSEVNKLLN